MKQKHKKFNLLAYLFQIKNVASGDDNGLSDPYISIYSYGRSGNTKAMPATLNAVFNKLMLIPIEYPVDDQGNIEEDPFVVASIFDYDKDDEDDFIG